MTIARAAQEMTTQANVAASSKPWVAIYRPELSLYTPLRYEERRAEGPAQPAPDRSVLHFSALITNPSESDTTVESISWVIRVQGGPAFSCQDPVTNIEMLGNRRKVRLIGTFSRSLDAAQLDAYTSGRLDVDIEAQVLMDDACGRHWQPWARRALWRLGSWTFLQPPMFSP